MRGEKRVLLFLLAPAIAAAQPTGPYVSLGAGVALPQNEIVTPNPSLGFDTDVVYTFHPGFVGEVGAGWQFGHLRAEIEGDYLDSVVRGAKEVLRYGGTPSRRAGGTEQKYGGFLNVIYDLDLGLPVKPYFGIGAGGQEVERHDFNQNIEGAVGRPPPAGVKLGYGRQTVGAFAYQGIVGVSVPLSFAPGLSFTADYRFIGLLDPMPALSLTQERIVFIPGASPGAPPSIGPLEHVILTPGPPPGFGRLERVIVTGDRRFTNDFDHVLLLGFRYTL